MDQTIAFSELRWLQELTYTKRKGVMPEIIGARLLK